jgi:hypothetical protein
MSSSDYAVIEESMTDNALDSPAITIDSSNTLHAAYRHYINAQSEWYIQYETSMNGQSWGSQTTIWSGSEEPLDDFVFIQADGQDELHSLFGVGGYLIYKSSMDGSSWSDMEVANPSADSNPPGIEDVMPRMVVTSDDIMHVFWIRCNPAEGYGSLYHRIRDVD